MSSSELLAEHGALLRHWAGVQARVSRQMGDQQQRCAALETELMQWRARWIVATTQMLWGLGWPSLAPVPSRVVRQVDEAPPSATDVLCQTGCASHAHPWRGDEGQCRLTGSDCTRVPPTAQERSARVAAVGD
ncbi:MAG: hypothetical protein QM772_18895 [Ottowia sp.]|uniref:hypothetical protein n=1 Tax=Ottowia sp. TaxID=1898956 RepID=UPI0039E33DB5